jgi:hypothetical protein
MSFDYVEIGKMYSDFMYKCLPYVFFVILHTTDNDVHLLLMQSSSHYTYQTVQSQKFVLLNLHHIKKHMFYVTVRP